MKLAINDLTVHPQDWFNEFQAKYDLTNKTTNLIYIYYRFKGD
mgnify:CR=1 FL=1